MAVKLILFVALVAAVSAAPLVPIANVAYAEAEAPAHYEFQYSVHDEVTGDIKQQHEARAGDDVHGSYSLVQPDGVHRIVEYTSSKEQGFNAVVRYEGHPIAPAPHKIAYAAPVAKLAYAAPVAKIAYAAPVHKVAYTSPVSYAAPVAKVAYSSPISYASPLTQVSFASPTISYHH